jgi:hypothetical protein
VLFDAPQNPTRIYGTSKKFVSPRRFLLFNKLKYLLLSNAQQILHGRCVPCEKKPTHIQAHLVFADTQANAEKPKELEFLPTLTRKRRN